MTELSQIHSKFQQNKERHRFWLDKLADSKLKDEDWKTLKEDLAGVFKGDKKKKNYLKIVKGFIERFNKKVSKEYEEDLKKYGIFVEEQEANEAGEKINGLIKEMNALNKLFVFNEC